MDWSKERWDAFVKACALPDVKSYQDVANILSKQFGFTVTKNSVIGVAYGRGYKPPFIKSRVFWTPDRRQRLIEVAKTKDTAVAVAAELSKEFGREVTPSSVVNAARDYGISIHFLKPKTNRVSVSSITLREDPKPKPPGPRFGERNKKGSGIPSFNYKSSAQVKAHVRGARCLWHECDDVPMAPGKPYCSHHHSVSRKSA